MTEPKSIRIGTRGSFLARRQSQQFLELLAPWCPQWRLELVLVKTTGDRLSGSLQQAGGKGLFVKELEEALLAGAIDLAVHSAKDLPAAMVPGLILAATPPRELPNDLWLGHGGVSWRELPAGAKVGSSSQRRQAQLLAMRPDLSVEVFRGNIDTRLEKVRRGEVAGTFLAAAGLRRAGLWPQEGELLATELMVPAAGQGTLAIEMREPRNPEDQELWGVLQKIQCLRTWASLRFERALVGDLAGDCLSPIGICAEPRASDAGWLVRGWVSNPAGTQVARGVMLSPEASAEGLYGLRGAFLALLESRGARDILARR